MSISSTSIEQLSINTIRTLSMDAVEQANSGHPGTPMALAPAAYLLWNKVLRYNPALASWPARDRAVLSCGHSSMLLYSVLHLADIRDDGKPAISLEDIKNFRQLNSPCAGHPEYGEAPGIETTTGPLGQGIGNSVGMAVAAKWFAANYDRPGFELFDYNTYALCSDGDIMEGLGYEAASLAGHLKLSNLCWIYDDNLITIEGQTRLAFSEDVAKRFQGMGWNTVFVEDANDLAAIAAALEAFSQCEDKPTIIILRSIIGFGAPNKQGSSSAHGSPLGEDEIKLAKQAYGWPEDEKFVVPEGVKEHFAAGIGARGKQACEAWQAKFTDYEAAHPQEAAQLKSIWAGRLPADWEQAIPVFEPSEKGMASRVSSGKVLNALAESTPWFLGGSADLAPSNMTNLDFEGAGHFSCEDYSGRNLHFGIREHSMTAICNGMSLCGLKPYCGTFFVFTDYLRPSMRLSSLMRQGVLFVLTHDSIGLGEDGPTHQPVEHLAACRAIPGLLVFRPGDANEAAECYRTALAHFNRPAAMVLSRQGLPTLDRTKYNAASGVSKGAYVLIESAADPQVILIGTGSETTICLAAYKQLTSQGINVRVVSMPCWELFEEQDQAYRESVLPPSVSARVAVEAGIEQGWERYLGPGGRFVGMSSFGASAPAGRLYEHFGVTAENVVAQARALLGQ